MHLRLTAQSQESVVIAKGEECRKAFFDDKNLDVNEGYKILMGGAPRLNDIDIEQPEDAALFKKHILTSIASEGRISDVIPSLLDMMQARMEGWGKEGRMDPFEEVYDLVFQMTVRMASCAELANDVTAVTALQSEFFKLEKSATPAALLLPWFPSKGRKDKETATTNLYMMIYNYVEARKAANEPSSDAIDLLLSQGLSTDTTVAYVLSTIFAGVVNTGINACWILLFLGFHKEWKSKVLAEVIALVSTYTDAAEPFHKRLSVIPVSAWENNMPVLDAVVRETIRLVLNTMAIRRNVVEEIPMASKTIPRGSFVAYPLWDAHLNPEIYHRPTEFDPARFGPGREEDKKTTFAYLGWGAGRHPCPGMKVAKLEIKVIVAFFLAVYEYDVVDINGNFPSQLSKPDYNDIQQASGSSTHLHAKLSN
ncbi:hypothetical protein H0H92_012548 [Tricholoma furcatifolium]|nr:hypothetical protein H0H92_012548 [Tricholoma furcatifolium]